MNITPTLVVLLQELERFNKLVNLMSQTLSLLRKALAGEIGMGNVLDEVAGALYNGQIPNYWRKLAPDTTKSLAYWIEHLNQRANQYRYWASSGEPLVMWLSGLHMPQSFLTALVQIACRKNNWPLDRSTLFTEVTHFADPDDVEERPESVSEVGGHPRKKNTELSLSVAFAILFWSHFSCFRSIPLPQRDATCMVCSWRAPAGASRSNVWRSRCRRCWSNRFPSCPSTRPKFTD